MFMCHIFKLEIPTRRDLDFEMVPFLLSRCKDSEGEYQHLRPITTLDTKNCIRVIICICGSGYKQEI